MHLHDVLARFALKFPFTVRGESELTQKWEHKSTAFFFLSLSLSFLPHFSNRTSLFLDLIRSRLNVFIDSTLIDLVFHYESHALLLRYGKTCRYPK